MKDLVCDVFLLGFSWVYLYQIICYIAKCKQKKYSSSGVIQEKCSGFA